MPKKIIITDKEGKVLSLKKLKAINKQERQDTLISLKDLLAKKLISKDKLDHYVKLGKLKTIVEGKKIFFYQNEILEMLKWIG